MPNQQEGEFIVNPEREECPHGVKPGDCYACDVDKKNKEQNK